MQAWPFFLASIGYTTKTLNPVIINSNSDQRKHNSPPQKKENTHMRSCRPSERHGRTVAEGSELAGSRVMCMLFTSSKISVHVSQVKENEGTMTNQSGRLIHHLDQILEKRCTKNISVTVKGPV